MEVNIISVDRARTLKPDGEIMKIGLVFYLISYMKRWIKRPLEQVYPRAKTIHVKLSRESMEESTHLITEVMKGEVMINIYGVNIILTPTMDR